MARKSTIEKEKKRNRLVAKYSAKRQEYKQQIADASSFRQKLEIHMRLQKLPRNSAPTRLKNRCMKTGRPHAYFRDFGLSRNLLRDMANEGLLPGVTKASWYLEGKRKGEATSFASPATSISFIYFRQHPGGSGEDSKRTIVELPL